ncbi:hypothetical protein [Pseudomonas sp. AB12(2023)]|uniref:hypothetical protein n=1 Tax=Pseudomonas sp. AB12(2023) TaxID=3048597 RepID=UPI002B226068|nr:hypothetical protein [Pseudomonas sp. AB12(2023)]MEB0222096.1 hypothetical protein [Pseudomonas sp. AB12(2023)]
MSKAYHLNEAMQWLKGALNCHLAAKVDGQSFIGGYVCGQVRDARIHLAAAKGLSAPRLP